MTLRNWPAVHFALSFLFVCGCCFAVLLFSLFGSSGMVRAIWSVYWSCVSSTFAAHLLWRWIHPSVLNDLAEAKRRWTEKKVCFVNSLFFFQKIKLKHKTKPNQLRAEIKSSFFARNSQHQLHKRDTHKHRRYTIKPNKCILAQSRSLYGRHVSTGFLDPVFGAMMKQACRQTLKSLAAECLVGVRLGLLNFLTPACVDWLFWLLAFGADGCLFWTDVVNCESWSPHGWGWLATCHSSSWHSSSWYSFMHGRLVDNIRLVVEEICAVDLQFGHNILLSFEPAIFYDTQSVSDRCWPRMWCIDQFYILFWILHESGTAYCLSWRYLHWLDIEISYRVFDTDQSILSKWWEPTAGNSWRRVWVSWQYLMGRRYHTLSFGTARCIGIVRTMAIFAHLICLRVCVMRCFGIVRTIPTSSSSWSTDQTFDLGLCLLLLQRMSLFFDDFDHRLQGQHCPSAILPYTVDWLLQWSKDYSDTTVFGWPTLWMSNRAFYSTLRFEAMRCYLYVENWFGDETFCFDYVLYSEEGCTEYLVWTTSFLRS